MLGTDLRHPRLGGLRSRRRTDARRGRANRGRGWNRMRGNVLGKRVQGFALRPRRRFGELRRNDPVFLGKRIASRRSTLWRRGRWRRRFRLERPRTVRSGLRQRQRPRHGFCRSRDTRNCGLARCRYRAHDVGFDNDVRRPADHHQMFDVVAPDQEQSSPRVDAGIFDYGQPRLASSHGATQSSAAESAHCPCGSPDQTKHYQECQKEAYGEWHFRAEQIKHPPNSPCRRHGN